VDSAMLFTLLPRSAVRLHEHEVVGGLADCQLLQKVAALIGQRKPTRLAGF
jgi:hypothetical protein